MMESAEHQMSESIDSDSEQGNESEHEKETAQDRVSKLLIKCSICKQPFNTIIFRFFVVKKKQQKDGIRSELKSMSFAELLKLKEELGSKVYNEAIFGESTSQNRKKGKPKTEFKRENKNRPREMSSKKQVPLLGKGSNSKKQNQPRDPRFDSKCGEFDRDKFKEDYSFVSEIREKEIGELKQQLRELRADQIDERNKIKLVMQRMKNQNLEEKKLKERKERKASMQQQNKNAIKNEMKPFFISKGK